MTNHNSLGSDKGSQRIVVALGGNALGSTPEEQLRLIKGTARSLADLVEEGHQVVVTHGNGPQVGMIKVATDFSATKGGGTPEIPFAECGAMSQGYIGFHLQSALDSELARRGIKRQAVSLVTQTVVNADDPAFDDPTKPVGAFFTAEEAEALAAASGDKYVEDAGRGWRKVVASPLPSAIVEAPVIQTLMDEGYVVVAAGGGGVPVVEHEGGYDSRSAVIDKDRTAALMAANLNADVLLILTAVPTVALGFNTPQQREIEQMSAQEAQGYIEAGEFAKGSMLPKVEACLGFVQQRPEGVAIITSLEQAKAGINGSAGTRIVADDYQGGAR
ncbi:MAG: carbamate kinase [Actinomycetaceae bacterium]|nr:carbamate kinase [Actinomycetaceae bacterium]MDY6083455.1 carbamate kinase [Actinomycetaceae bacterium]